jgi:hypothetical protein
LQAEARLLIVGMMGKILAGDVRGISAVLLERLQQTMTQVWFAFHIIAYVAFAFLLHEPWIFGIVEVWYRLTCLLLSDSQVYLMIEELT